MLHFWEMNSYGCSEDLWNTITVDEALCTSPDDSFGRNTVGKELKSLSRVSILVSISVASCMMEVVQTFDSLGKSWHVIGSHC